MPSEMYSVDYHYKDNLIGRGHNMMEHHVDYSVDEWENLGEDYWCNVNHYIFMEADTEEDDYL